MRHRPLRAVTGALFLLVAVAAAVIRCSGPEAPRQLAPEELQSATASLGGFSETLSLGFDSSPYSGQQAARVVSVDVLLEDGAGREILSGSLEAAARLIRSCASVSRKIVVTGYRRREDYESGLAFAARGMWLAGEFAAPVDGWEVVRLPDEKRPAAEALGGIYASAEVVSAEGGRLVAEVDLSAEEIKRPAADIRELLVAPLVDCFDYDNAFERSPELVSLEVSVLDGERTVGRVVMSRQAWEALDVPGLRAALAREVLASSADGMKLAEKYTEKGLFTPLLFDSVVSAEDKEAVLELAARREAALDEFYEALFAGDGAQLTTGESR